MDKLYGMGEAARMIGISASALKWQLLYGKVGDVERRGPSGARLFTDGDIARLRTALGRQGAQNG